MTLELGDWLSTAATTIAGRTGPATITRLAVMPQAGSKFFQRDTAVVVGIEAGENSGDASGIDIGQSWQGGEFVSIEATVIACDFGEALSALGFDFSADRLASVFPFFVG
jgi:hypothetical protein